MKRTLKLTVFLVSLNWSAICFAQTADVGNFIVVSGALRGCEEWTGRILDVEKIEDDQPLRLLNLPGISVIGLDGEGILQVLESAVLQQTGNKPKSLSVQVIDSVRLPRTIFEEYGVSLRLMIDDECPEGPIDIPAKRKLREYKLEEDIQKIRQMELSRAVASGFPPGRSPGVSVRMPVTG